jgi:hypothetical protein
MVFPFLFISFSWELIGFVVEPIAELSIALVRFDKF